MDGLSLLCNLHADGPLALRRLRAAGVRELEDLEGLAESTLSECLRSSSAHARRFVEEARQLARRLAESQLEPEPSWEATASLRPVPRPAESPATSSMEPRAYARARRAEAGLEPGALVGLDERTCERLAAQGVHTLDELHERASLVLARAAGIPLTKLLGLAAQARLASSTQGANPHACLVVPEVPRHTPSLTGLSVASPHPVHPAARPWREHASEPGPAGPFG